MNPEIVLKVKFVEFIPETLQDGTLYVSLNYATAIHLCCCGCRREVVTPLSPKRWQLSFDGEAISIFPSIGNWSMPCRSHYFITNSQVEWVPEVYLGQRKRGQQSLIKPHEHKVLKESFFKRFKKSLFS